MQVLMVVIVLGILAALTRGLSPLAPGIATGLRMLGHPMVLLAVVAIVVLLRLRPRRGPDERP